MLSGKPSAIGGCRNVILEDKCFKSAFMPWSSPSLVTRTVYARTPLALPRTIQGAALGTLGAFPRVT
jgi:hypothetical protein